MHNEPRQEDRIARMHSENQTALRENNERLRALSSVVTDVKDELSNFNQLLNGPPGKPEQGLIFKHTWLEKSVGRVSKLFWAAILAVVAGLAELVWHSKVRP